MRLKSLNIKGFKSFANQTTIHFSHDVIGIVGPNGSGKSNIVDAVRWVLGEQSSKELRLEAMGDIIFNGTKTKKEGAAAVVEFIFENNKGLLPSEYQTVSVSRTLYRSGESAYRLNNVVCRLKDIRSLFVDTGIGSNSYAIIALGMVDDILSDKDDARRKMFEQAAGISKYRIRKKETLNKLKSTATDLNRIEDLLFEIEGNMKSLEKQARRTKKYFQIKEEYKVLSIENAVHSIHSLKNKYKSTNQQIIDKTDAYQKVVANLNTLESQLQTIKKDNLSKEQSLSNQQKELSQIVSNIRNKENDKNLLKQKIEFKSQNINNTKKLLLDLNESKSVLNTDLLKINRLYQSEIKKGDGLQSKKIELEEIYQDVKSKQSLVKKEMDEKALKIRQISEKIYSEEKQIAITNNSIENRKSENLRRKDNLKFSYGEIKNLNTKIEEIQSNYALKIKEAENIKNLEIDRKSKLIKLEEEKSHNQTLLNKINRKIDSKQNEYDLLKSMIESFEGFPESIKFLSSNWSNDFPLLTDIVEVEDAFSGVIEQYLEPYLNYYIVEDIAQAARAIRLLAGAQKGKANFFLLNKFRVAGGQNTVSIPRTKSALEVVYVEDKYHNLLHHLLENVYLYDGAMDDFMLEEMDDKFIFLSNLGTFLKTKNTVSGGSVGLFEGIKIGRKKNLDKIKNILTKSNEKRDGLNSKSKHILQKISLLKSSDKGNEANKILQEANQINQQLVRLSSKIDHLNAGIKDNENFIDNAEQAIQKLSKTLSQSERAVLGYKNEILQYEKGNEGKNTKFTSLNDKMSQASDAFNKANISLIQQQNYLQNLEKDLLFKTSRTKELTTRIENESRLLQLENKENEKAKEQIIVLEKALQDLYIDQTNFKGNLSEAEQAFYQVRNEIVEIEEKNRLLSRKSNQLQLEINNLKDVFNDLKFSINAVGDRLKIEFEVDINTIINKEPDKDVSFEQLKIKVEKLRNKIHNFGEINPMALEAYEEIKIRYDHILVQREDIFKAKESLSQTMKEIENTATKQYLSSFEKIRENFIMVFRSLFTEDDNCDLVLLDPEKPIDSKIEIIAKPKGKKPKSLSQLSGGEKTLTATALLFALYLLKPAPFCIFDEVDAPLDDANIQKFNRIIQKFSKESQFIIVTHNKATMQSVDVLYGVYMSEPGISSVTPVDFSNVDRDTYLDALN